MIAAIETGSGCYKQRGNSWEACRGLTVDTRLEGQLREHPGSREPLSGPRF